MSACNAEFERLRENAGLHARELGHFEGSLRKGGRSAPPRIKSGSEEKAGSLFGYMLKARWGMEWGTNFK